MLVVRCHLFDCYNCTWPVHLRVSFEHNAICAFAYNLSAIQKRGEVGREGNVKSEGAERCTWSWSYYFWSAIERENSNLTEYRRKMSLGEDQGLRLLHQAAPFECSRGVGSICGVDFFLISATKRKY